MTITEFLTARFDEDEERASSGWSRIPEERWENTNEGQSVLTPRAVLADIAAKRAIVALHSEGAMACYWSQDSMEMHGPGEVCDTLQALAQPYATHPDFDESWKP